MTSCPCGRETLEARPSNAVGPGDIPSGVVTCRYENMVYLHPIEAFFETVLARGDAE